MTHKDSITTRTVRAALETDTQHGAVVPPIHLTSTFAFSGYGEKREYDYSRSGNPTRDALGARPRRTRRRRRRNGHGIGHGRGLARHAAGAARAARRRAARLLWRHVPAVQCVARARLAERPLRGLPGAGGARGGAGRPARARLDRDAEQPVAAHRRHRGRGRSGQGGRRARRWPTTRSCRPSGSSRSRSVRTSSCIRRPST